MDKTVTVDDFTLGVVNRVASERYDVGGKGINVAKVLKNFGEVSICMGFLGGIWENEFKKELKSRGIIDEFIRIEKSTRTNMKIVDAKNKVFTDVNAPGPIIEEEELKVFFSRFSELCKPGDIVVLSGGVAPGIPADIYAKLIRMAKGNGAKVILDAEGELLREGIKEKPDIIKPNAFELGKLMGIDENNHKELVEAALKLKDIGVNSILVSLGEKGAFYVSDEGIYITNGVKVSVKSTVGAGDSMVAALVYCLKNNISAKETLRFANACGAVSVSLEGTEACKLKDVNEMVKKINITEWEM